MRWLPTGIRDQLAILIFGFGAPLHDLTIADLARPGIIFQIGVPPVRIDILTKIDGLFLMTHGRADLR